MKRLTLARAVATACGAFAASHAIAAAPEDLSACGAIADPTERLACYDRLAGRPAAPAPAQVTPKPAGAVPSPAPPPPVVATPTSPAAPAAAAPASPVPAAQPGSAAKPVAGAAAATSFGSYSAEHPKTAPALPQTLSARVTAMGKTIDGRPTVTLEGGALWLLDEVDPLLAVGDTVTISRGTFSSFLLETPTKRLHHVRRIS